MKQKKSAESAVGGAQAYYEAMKQKTEALIKQKGEDQTSQGNQTDQAEIDLHIAESQLKQKKMRNLLQTLK